MFATKGTTKLLCAWHVDRAWRTALNDHVPSKESRIKIYHQLRLLLRNIVQSSVTAIFSFLDGGEERFCKYFKEHYCNRLEQWASFSQAGTIANTNMFVEAIHRTLKTVYLQHKQNRRIDFLVHTLLKIARDKMFEQLTKLEKGKSQRVTEINET